jgi:hypothetical protein
MHYKVQAMENYKVKDFTFRHLFHQIVFIDLKSGGKGEALAMLDGKFELSEDANGVLCYGYIDYENGFTFEVLATAFVEDGKISLNKGNDKVSYKMRMSSVNDCDVFILDKKAMNFSAFDQKIAIIDNAFKTDNNAVDRLRCMTELDGCRSREFPDDVIVYLAKNGVKPESAWVRCMGYDDENKKIVGKLLTEPNSVFNRHIDDEISFVIAKNGEDLVCICVLN